MLCGALVSLSSGSTEQPALGPRLQRHLASTVAGKGVGLQPQVAHLDLVEAVCSYL